MIDLGTLQLKIEAKTDDAVKAIEKAGDTADKTSGKQSLLSKAASVSRKAFLGLSAAATATYAAMKKYLGLVAGEGDEIDKQSQKLHVNAEQYQTLKLAAERSGFSMSAFTKATTKAMGAGYDNIYDFLEELDKMPNSADKAAKAQEVLGTKTANELAPLIEGKESVKEYKDELEKLGYYSEDAVKNSAAYEDALTNLHQTFTIIKNVIAEKVLPVVTDALTKLTDWVTTHKDTLESFGEKVGSVLTFIVNHIKQIGMVLAGLGIASTILTIITSVASLISAVQTIATVVTVASLGWVAAIAAVIAIIVLLATHWKQVKKLIKKGITFVLNSKPVQRAKEFIDKLRDAWEKAKKLAKKAVSFAVKIPGVQTAIDAFKKLKSWWDKIKDGGSATYTTTSKKKHRIGLKEVPFDGYAAELHKGEAILTASEANQYKQLLNGGAQTGVTTSGTTNATFILELDGKVLGQNSVEYINGQTVQFNVSPLMV